MPSGRGKDSAVRAKIRAGGSNHWGDWLCLRRLKENSRHTGIQVFGLGPWGAGGSALQGGEHLWEEVCQAETCGEVFPQNFPHLSLIRLRTFWQTRTCSCPRSLGTLGVHVTNIRVEWSTTYPSRVLATATKRLLIYNDMEDEDEEGDEDEVGDEEESVLASTW